MYFSYKSSAQQQKPPIYSSQYGSYVRLSSFAQKGTDFKLDFNINLFGLSESQVLKLVQDFAKENRKTQELRRALESKKEKGGVRFVWGFLSLISGDSYDKGYNRSSAHINQSSSELEVLFYERLFSVNPSTITVSGRGTTKSTQKTSVNLQILTITEEKTKREISIIFSPKTENFHQDNQVGQLIEQHQHFHYNLPHGLCGLQSLYSPQNNFNLQPSDSDQISDRFPTPQQASSLLSHYYEKLKDVHEGQNKGSKVQRAAIAFPTEEKFKNDVNYKSKLWPIGKTLKYYFMEPKVGETYLSGYQNQIPNVEWAFQVWKNTGLNLDFKRTENKYEADIRISFALDEKKRGRSYSYVGTDSIRWASDKNKETMNFGWRNLRNDGTALHQIGHALGFYHQQQSPSCEIQWNKKRVKEIKKAHGNDWTDQMFERNIFAKLPVGAAMNSKWDPTSIMQYGFDAQQLLGPHPYDRTGIKRNTQLSANDIEYIRRAYPKTSTSRSTSSATEKEDINNHVNTTYRNIISLLRNAYSSASEYQENEIQDEEPSHFSRRCALSSIYSQQNNFNLEPIQCKKASDAFPTQQQAKSLFNAYLKSLEKLTAQHKSGGHLGAQSATFAYPTQDQFKKSNQYKSKLWPIGTTITYCFLKSQKYRVLKTKQQDIYYFPKWEQNIEYVNKAFKVWKDTGINLNFKQVPQPSEQNLRSVNIRITFYENGSYSNVGTDCLHTKELQTMNFGWDFRTRQTGTGIHEIGHALGLYHQHQNPASKLKWNRKKVIDDLSRPPNNWDLEDIQTNVLSVLPGGSVTYSEWDPKSIMHYGFPKSQILAPEYYRLNGVKSNQVLSELDKEWILQAYPPASTKKTESFEQLGEDDHTSQITFNQILSKLKTIKTIYEAISAQEAQQTFH